MLHISELLCVAVSLPDYFLTCLRDLTMCRDLDVAIIGPVCWPREIIGMGLLWRAIEFHLLHLEEEEEEAPVMRSHYGESREIRRRHSRYTVSYCTGRRERKDWHLDTEQSVLSSSLE